MQCGVREANTAALQEGKGLVGLMVKRGGEGDCWGQKLSLARWGQYRAIESEGEKKLLCWLAREPHPCP